MLNEQTLTDLLVRAPNAEKGMCAAFSGGVDSAVVLRAACSAARALGGVPVYAVYFATALHPAGERAQARSLAEALGVSFHVLEVDELDEAGIGGNPPDRCYRCKRLLFRRLRAFAQERGVSLLLDGTNADDVNEYRPGLRALAELEVCSPLRLAGARKSEVRALAREWGLPVSEKPSAPCLATRFPYGECLTREKLARVGQAEERIKALGFAALRVRSHGDTARVEVPPAELARLLEARERVTEILKDSGFDYCTLDLEGLRSGSMDIALLRAQADPGK